MAVERIDNRGFREQFGTKRSQIHPLSLSCFFSLELSLKKIHVPSCSILPKTLNVFVLLFSHIGQSAWFLGSLCSLTQCTRDRKLLICYWSYRIPLSPVIIIFLPHNIRKFHLFAIIVKSNASPFFYFYWKADKHMLALNGLDKKVDYSRTSSGVWQQIWKCVEPLGLRH